jgi:hypothetical protein
VNSAWNRFLERSNETLGENPFARLVIHFVNRSFRGGAESDSEDLDFSTGLLLMLLPIPGTFVSLLFYDKYSSLLQILRRDLIKDPYSASLGDEYLFVVVSMVVTGIIAVWRWDSILVDRRDFANLVHLPVSAGKLFSANLIAILFLTALFAFEVNVGSALLFPLVVSSSYPQVSFYASFALGHLLGVTLASVFTFAAVIALMGTLMAALPYRTFRRASQYLRILLVVLFMLLLMTSFVVAPLLSTLDRHPDSILRFLPSVWFLSLCEAVRHAGLPVFQRLGIVGLIALVGAVILAFATYAISVRRCFLSIPETVDRTASKRTFLLPFLLQVANRFYLPTAASRACYAFVLQTLTRSEKHFTSLGAFAGLGLLLSAEALLTSTPHGAEANARIPGPGLLSIPLVFVYCLVVGLRLVFEIPADLRANWIFKLQIDPGKAETVRLGRSLAWTILAPCLFLIYLPVCVYEWGWPVAALHIAFATVMTALLVETMMGGLHKIPFTCSLPVFKENAFVMVFFLLFGFYVFVEGGSFLEYLALLFPIRVILPAIALGVWWIALRQYGANRLEIDKRVIFEEGPVETV